MNKGGGEPRELRLLHAQRDGFAADRARLVLDRVKRTLRPRFTAALLGLLSVCAAGAAFAVSPSLVFENPRAEFGEVYQGSTVEHTFRFENRGSAPITLLAVLPRAEGATGEAIPRVVPPRGRGEVRVRIPIGDRLGQSNFRIAIDSDDPVVPRVRLGLSGFVESAYEPADAKIDFGEVDAAKGLSASIPLASREIERLEVERITTSESWISAAAEGRSGELGEGIRFRATLAANAPLGLRRGTVTLHTNVASQPQVTLPFAAAIYREIVPDRNPVSLGLARIGEEMHGQVRLVHRDGEPFDFRSVEAPTGIEVLPAPCPGAETQPSCLMLRVIARPTVPGTLEGELTVSFVGAPSRLPLRFSGIVAGTNTEIRQIDLTRLPSTPESEPWATDGGASSASRSSEPSGASTPPNSTTPLSASPSPEAVLRWQASNEGGVYGYQVLRSRDRVGPFVRVNDEIVRVRDRATGSQSYEFRDRKVEFGATYHYYLDLVTVGGTTRRFSGVLSKTVPPSPVAALEPSSDARNPNP